MSKINILDPSIYNLIAAGEVVERPVSVVKELVENSIDAGATDISIEIKDGGTTFIEVSDNGCGIEESDFKSAFLPHATSKISNASDLEKIGTLGFRGEALASIASVAKVTLMSKTKDAELATSLSVEGGVFGEMTKTSSNVGTTITVKDLFFCVPARAKFLKKDKTEEQEITGMITRIILAHPEIHFTYTINGKKSLSSLGSSAKEALFSVYGKSAVDETMEVHSARENVSVYGFVGKPTFSKSNRNYQTLIVNGRYVINLTVQTAVTNAFGDFLMKRQYPFFVLYLNIPSNEIDVNVHPNKLDVRFLKTPLVYSVVFEAVSRGLHEMDYVKEVSLENENNSFRFNQVQSKSPQIDKAGVNLNPFSASFEKMNSDERNNISNMVLDSVMTNNQDGVVRDNFGIGSKLLERINAKIKAGDSDAYDSPNYSLNGHNADLSANKISNESVKTTNQESFYDDKKSQNNTNNVENLSNNDEKLSFDANNNMSFGLYDKKESQDKQDNYNYMSANFKNPNFIKSNVKQDAFFDNDIKMIGKLFNTYLVIEWGDNVYLIDQHAAHERLRYEKLKEQYENGKLVIQPLLIPYVLSLSSEDDQIINANLDAIRSVGFDIDEFGDRTYKVSAVPAIVSEIDFNEFFAMFLADKLNKNKITKAELIKDNLMQMACKSAVKGGDDLSVNEINKLLYEMSSQNVTLFCPHGRPIVVRITKNEIEKWFKRIV